MSQRSITPTTFKNFTPILIDEKQALIESCDTSNSNAFLEHKREEFQKSVESSNQALKKATDGVINHSRLTRSELELMEFDKEFGAKIDVLEKYSSLVSYYYDFLVKEENQGLELYCNEQYANSTTIIHRFGINTDPLQPTQSEELAGIFDKTVAVKAGSVSSATSKKAMDYPHMLHPLEVFRIKQAIKHCTTGGHKTVLVDIFERKDDGSIVIGDDKKPGIHTVVLCMQGDQILVIEPSNSDFSKHLAYNGDVICGYDHPKQILVSDMPLKIYSPPTKAPTGPNPNEYRDCTDVAVKLAFGLEKHVGLIDMKKLAELGVVREVTNQKDINNDFAFIFEKVVPARVRQASDDATREKANKLLGSGTKQAQCAELYDDSTTSDKIVLAIRAHLELECPCDKYSDHLMALEAIHKSNIGLVGQMMEDAIV